MEYQVLARKYRPKTFSDMIGQEHITKTLQNALVSSKTAHAYLFVGPRGIGKTTIARIFAKTLNCKEAPTPYPCEKCSSCLSISEGSSIDIIEIDGASNNSVNDIRNLREEVSYTPTSSRYKIYIIDEVHMLSNQAWNALLKTLEEPPPHVKFLFATTEAHKILPTVLSRCQRFDLKRISMKQIVERLAKIAELEGVKVNVNALRAIAKAADGGMRDALSLMDQMIAFHSSGTEIDENEILNTFGLTSIEKIFEIVKAILTNDYSAVVLNVNRLANNGKNIESLFDEILDHLRGIQITLLIPNSDDILEKGEDIIFIYKEIGKLTNITVIQRLLESLSVAGRIIRDSLNKQISIETSILKAMHFANSMKIDDIIIKMTEIKKNRHASRIKTDSFDLNSMPNEQGYTDSESFKKKSFEEIKSVDDIYAFTDKADSLTNNINTVLPEDIIRAEVYYEPKSEVDIIDSTESLLANNDVDCNDVDKKLKINDIDDPLILWQNAIINIALPKFNKPELSSWMQSGQPKSLFGNVLIVEFDSIKHSVNIEILQQNLTLIHNVLHELTGNNEIILKINSVKNSIKESVVHDIKKENKVENSQFLNDILEIFEGRTVKG